MTRGVVSRVGLAWAIAATGIARAGPDVGVCADGYARCQARYEHFAATMERKIYTIKYFDNNEDGRSPADGLGVSSVFRMWRDGTTARMKGSVTIRKMNVGKLAEEVLPLELLVTPGESIQVPLDTTLKKMDGESLIGFIRSPEEDMLRQLLHRAGDLILLDGAIDILGPSLAQKLAAAKVAATADRIDGRDVVRLDFEDDWGIHAVWLDPARDYHLVKLTQRKLPRHLFRPGSRLEKISYGPDLKIVERVKECVATGFRRVGGLWFAEGFETRMTETTDTGKQVVVLTTTKMSAISTDPTSGGNTFKLSVAVPDGTRVTVADQRPIKFEWRNGAIVKAVSQPRAEALAKQEFRRPSRSWAWWLGGAVAFAALVGGVWISRRRFSLRRG